MTKEEKLRQKVMNKIFRDQLREKSEQAKQYAREVALEDTLLFHAREMEKILHKQMPKGWSMKVNLELMDETGDTFCSAECSAKSGLQDPIGTSASIILSELLDKHNINYHIQNGSHHE